MIDEFVERMKNRRMILTVIRERCLNDSLSKKCETLINLIDETIMVHCSIYN